MFKPMRSLLLIRPIKANESQGGILLPENSRPLPGRATVLAVGPGLRYNDQLIPTGYAVGDEIVYIPNQAVNHPALEPDTAIIEAELVWGKLVADDIG